MDEILKDLDSFTEGPEDSYEDDIDIDDDEDDATGYDEPYEEADDDDI